MSRLRAVLAGEPISLPVEGGFRTKPAVADGYYLDTDWPEFIPADQLEAARKQLADSIKLRSAGRMALVQVRRR